MLVLELPAFGFRCLSAIFSAICFVVTLCMYVGSHKSLAKCRVLGGRFPMRSAQLIPVATPSGICGVPQVASNL